MTQRCHPDSWDPVAVIAACPAIVWSGHAWRIHRQTYSAVDASGSRKASGRYHRGLDLVPEEQAASVLYLALSAETCLGELMRHITPAMLPRLNGYRLSELFVNLNAVIDARQPETLGLTIDDLCRDYDLALPQALGQAARDSGAEGVLVPSATRLGDNLIVFVQQLRPESSLSIVSSRDPRLVPTPVPDFREGAEGYVLRRSAAL